MPLSPRKTHLTFLSMSVALSVTTVTPSTIFSIREDGTSSVFAHRKSGNFVRVSLSVSSRAMIDKPQISLSRVKYQPARDFRPFRCCVVLLFGWNFGFYALHNQGNEWRPHRSLSRNHTGSRVRIICKHCVICDDVVSLLAYASDWQAVEIINIKKIPPI